MTEKVISLDGLSVGPYEAGKVLIQAAQEFDRRAQLPEYGGSEKARIFACATWLRDMAWELGERDEE